MAMDTQSAFDVQVGGSHYKNAAMQPAEFWLRNQLPATEGAVVKYMFRWRAKDGVRDLKKARHFIEMMIEEYFIQRRTQPRSRRQDWLWSVSPSMFCDLNRLDPQTTAVICKVCNSHSETALRSAIEILDQMIDTNTQDGPVQHNGDGAVTPVNDGKHRAQHALYVAIDRIEDYRALLESFVDGNLRWRDAKIGQVDDTLKFLRDEARA